MEEKSILDLYAARDERAIEETTLKYGSSLKNVSLNILRDAGEAEECLNDVLLNAWNSIPPFFPDNLFAWLAKCIRNISLNRVDYHNMSKRRAEFLVLTEELEKNLLSPENTEDSTMEKELIEKISQYLRGIKKEQRVIFIRRYWYGDSIEEISKRMAVGESKVKTTLHRIRKNLREFLEKEGMYL